MFPTLIYSLTALIISQLPLLLANGSYDEEDRFRSSGSGGVIIEPSRDLVPYKKVEIKFVTKHAFQNSPNSGIFMAEVVDELTYALNSEGGPVPGIEHRPALVQVEEIKRENTDNDYSPSQRPGNNPMKFRGFIGVPFNVDVEQYFERIRKNKFFHSLRRIREDNKQPINLRESQLIEYEFQRLPPRTSSPGPGIEIIPGEPKGNTKGEEPTNNQPGNINIEVHYKSLPGEFFRDPATLAAMIAAALAGLLCTILCTVFVVYRMRKKDEGSYALDEPKNTYRYNKEIYIASATKEFFA